jgi:molecular chaperone HtpG
MRYPIYLIDIEQEKEKAKEREEAAKEKAKEEKPDVIEVKKDGETTPEEATTAAAGGDDEDLDDLLDDTPEAINDTEPLWKKAPNTLEDEDYKKFYKKLFPVDPEPLFWIHLKVDHPFELDGILYFPKLNPNKPIKEQNIKLYAKQVFVSDNVKDVIPEFLGLLKGTIDSTDIPLNVSRSALQGDPNIKKISNYIIKKVAEGLKKLYRKDRERYEKIWEDIGLFVKYGCISDTKFDELCRHMVLFKDSEDKLVTMEEYVEKQPKEYEEKLKGKLIYFEQGKSDPALKNQLWSEKIHVVETENYIDPHFMQHVEMKKVGDHELKFVSIDSEVENLLACESTTDKDIKIKDLFRDFLINKKDSEKKAKEDEKKEEAVPTLANKDNLEVEVKAYKNATTPAYFKYDEQMKRLAQMTRTMGTSAMQMPVKKTLVINPANPLVQNALKIWEKGEKTQLVEKICNYVQDIATISGEGFQDTNEKNEFVKRSQDLVAELSQYAAQ